MTSSPELLPCPFCGDPECPMYIMTQGDKWGQLLPLCLEVRTGYDQSEDAPWRTEAAGKWNHRIGSLIPSGTLETVLAVLGDAKNALAPLAKVELAIQLLEPYRKK